MGVVIKPWGTYRVLYECDDTKIKMLCIRAGEAISLQYHEKRLERWLVLKGKGIIDVNYQKEKVQRGNEVLIPAFIPHRVEAVEDLTILEVQEGVCEEEDIVRLEDKYGRCDN